MARAPQNSELDHLLSVYHAELGRFRQDPSSAAVTVGKNHVPAGVTVEELAAWFYVANILLNLDETITKG